METKSLLLGEAASLDAQDRITSALGGAPGIDRIIHMKTLHLGPDELLVGAKIAVSPTATAAQVATAIDEAERRIRAAEPTATVIYLEPDIFRDSEPDREPAVNNVLAVLGVLLVLMDYVIKFLAIGVLPSNKKPSSAMAWLILILIIPFAGFIIFLFLGRTNVGAKRLARQREAEEAIRDGDRPAARLPGPRSGLPRLDGRAEPEPGVAAPPGRQPHRADPGLQRLDPADDGGGRGRRDHDRGGVLHRGLGRGDQPVLRRSRRGGGSRGDRPAALRPPRHRAASPATRSSSSGSTPPASTGTRCCRCVR